MNVASNIRVPSPSSLKVELPLHPDGRRSVSRARAAVRNILLGEDDKLLVVVGPCSIHEPQAALDYAQRLALLRATLGADLEIVMRAYLEKPRTCLGWKGFVNDPYLNETYDIEAGLRLARQLLLEITGLGLPVATEFLDVTTHQYLSDLVSWGAIGARTTESQIHREMASGLPCAIGFKNGTDGNVKIAIDAIRSAAAPHHFLAISEDGSAIRQSTAGNPSAHLVLRGGKQPNFDPQSVDLACSSLASHGLATRIMIDASHGNSGKFHMNQLTVCDSIGSQLAAGEHRIAGVMIESHLVAGNQSLNGDAPLVYGQSVTDACISWDDTVAPLMKLAHSVRLRRNLGATPAKTTVPAAAV
ncbi:3-deoxy-7-phosphoheptulonate synthase [Paraburkholderia xenovorans]|uniref:3-deoxy-7-phosphoheptulonate synthase n=1 Tax=Paraburkholderia xenovorans TaxID=36873 RepID=UPI0038BBA96E